MMLPIQWDSAKQKYPDMPYVKHLTDLLSTDLDFHDQPSDYASHNFHSFPAKFPPQLPKKFINGLTNVGDVVLDPMAGSGTTVLEAFLSSRSAIGFDIDPLALMIAKVKTTPFDPKDLIKLTQRITINAELRIRDHEQEIKDTINAHFDDKTKTFIDQWFLPSTQVELQALIDEIQHIEDPEVRVFFEVAFSAIIVMKSGGVSLALDLAHTRPHLPKKVVTCSGLLLAGDPDEKVPHYLTKIHKSALQEFEKRCLQNLRGIVNRNPNPVPCQVNFGDAQDIPLKSRIVDLIITSPPYASNAIDYMRAHKFSLVWLGYPIDDLGKKRKEYIGGELVADFPFEVLPQHSQSVVNAVYKRDRKKSFVLHRYYSEMARVLKEMLRVLKPGKAAILVVGNSMMKSIDTEIPARLTEIGQTIGFQVPGMGVRQLDRNKRMLPAGKSVNLDSQIEQRMHEEYVIAFWKPE